MPTTENVNDIYLSTLHQYWGYDSFRGVQREIIESVGAGKDTLGLMPTGGGKSITFQVPTLTMKGLCIVVTPLIALMKDQVSQLRMRGIKAACVYSGMMANDIERILDNCILGDYKFLYVSPERLQSERFRQKVTLIRRICMICVDEAHCISQWGYDFRPSYMRINDLRHIIPYHVPVLALTATATPKVVDDIQDRLEFKERNVFSMSFERKNLSYVVRETADKTEEMLNILKKMPEVSGIVYTRSRRLTREIANYLEANGITADSYHAGLTNAEKDLRQANWTKGNTRIMVATNAFGMGIDKPDVRIVIHYNVPDSIEAYFQEAGRAGRDGKHAYAVLLYNQQDKGLLQRRVDTSYPSIDYIKQTYENVSYFLQVGEGEGYGHTYYFALELFCRKFKQFAVDTDSALRILSTAGYIDYQEEQEFKSRLKFTVTKESLYRLHTSNQQTDNIIQAILRTYTGVFADYVFIEETLLSHITGYENDIIYNTLIELSQRQIISFIPHRNTPTITYTVPRVDTSRIQLPPIVYTDRKKDYAQRIESIVNYFRDDTTCRSRQLLHYFGETKTHDCDQCDVCIRRKRNGFNSNDINTIRQRIKQLLSDNQPHPITEIHALNGNKQLIQDTITIMVQEEEIKVKGSKIVKS